MDVPAGDVMDCVEFLETTPLEPGAESTKRYYLGKGLVVNNLIKLAGFGFNPRDD